MKADHGCRTIERNSFDVGFWKIVCHCGRMVMHDDLLKAIDLLIEHVLEA